MRVLILATDVFSTVGGIGVYVTDLVRATGAHLGVEEVGVVARIPGDPGPDIPDTVHLVTPRPSGRVSFAVAALRTAWQGRPWDVVICAHIHLLSLAWLAALVSRTRPVLVIYGIEAWSPTRFMVGRLTRRMKAVVSISRFTLERFLEWSRYPGATHVLPNAVHLDRYAADGENAALRERYGLTGRRVVMTLGRMDSAERYKGFDEVLGVIEQIAREEPTVSYLICGDGNDRSRLEATARRLGVADRTVFAGRIQEAEKAAHYRLADAFVMPSRGEGFGFVFLEAMACGTPVVASSVDGGREAVQDGVLGGLVDPSDSASLARAILAALRRPRGVPAGLDAFAYPRFEAQWHALLERTRRLA